MENQPKKTAARKVLVFIGGALAALAAVSSAITDFDTVVSWLDNHLIPGVFRSEEAYAGTICNNHYCLEPNANFVRAIEFKAGEIFRLDLTIHTSENLDLFCTPTPALAPTSRGSMWLVVSEREVQQDPDSLLLFCDIRASVQFPADDWKLVSSSGAEATYSIEGRYRLSVTDVGLTRAFFYFTAVD